MSDDVDATAAEPMIVEPTDSDLEQWEVRMYDGKGATGVSSSSALTRRRSSLIAMATHALVYWSSFGRFGAVGSS